MQDQAGPFAGCPPRSRSVAEMDGCSRQNPAYRLATERAPTSGALSICPLTVPFSPAELTERERRSFGRPLGRGLERAGFAPVALVRRASRCEHVFDDRLRP